MHTPALTGEKTFETNNVSAKLKGDLFFGASLNLFAHLSQTNQLSYFQSSGLITKPAITEL